MREKLQPPSGGRGFSRGVGGGLVGLAVRRTEHATGHVVRVAGRADGALVEQGLALPELDDRLLLDVLQHLHALLARLERLGRAAGLVLVLRAVREAGDPAELEVDVGRLGVLERQLGRVVVARAVGEHVATELLAHRHALAGAVGALRLDRVVGRVVHRHLGVLDEEVADVVLADLGLGVGQRHLGAVDLDADDAGVGLHRHGEAAGRVTRLGLLVRLERHDLDRLDALAVHLESGRECHDACGEAADVTDDGVVALLRRHVRLDGGGLRLHGRGGACDAEHQTEEGQQCDERPELGLSDAVHHEGGVPFVYRPGKTREGLYGTRPRGEQAMSVGHLCLRNSEKQKAYRAAKELIYSSTNLLKKQGSTTVVGPSVLEYFFTKHSLPRPKVRIE